MQEDITTRHEQESFTLAQNCLSNKAAHWNYLLSKLFVPSAYFISLFVLFESNSLITSLILIHLLRHYWKASPRDISKLDKGYTHTPTHSLMWILFFWSCCLLRELAILFSLYIYASQLWELTMLKPGCKTFWGAVSSHSKARINHLNLMK